MKKKNNKACCINSYLNATGVLENGTVEEIQEVKKKYWAQYRKEWNKAKRKECSSFEILFNSKELKAVTGEAISNHVSPTSYIKRSALATKRFNDPIVIGAIRQLIFIHRNTVENLIEERRISADDGSKLMDQIEDIEIRSLNYLHH